MILRNDIWRDSTEDKELRELVSSQLMLVNINEIGARKIEDIRKPITRSSGRMQFVDDVIGEDLVYREIYIDNGYANFDYFLANLRTGKSRKISEGEKEKILMRRSAITFQRYGGDKTPTSVWIRTPQMKSPIQISDPSYNSSEPRIISGNRVVFKSHTDSDHSLYVLNIK